MTESRYADQETIAELERLQAEVDRLKKSSEALQLALETESQAATAYAQQVAYWVEKHDALRQQIEDAKNQEPDDKENLK